MRANSNDPLKFLTLTTRPTEIRTIPPMPSIIDGTALANQIRDQVKGTFLEHAPAIPTSAVTGQGLEALRAALDRVTPPDRDVNRPFRLPVDRAFARKGFGTVVTGTAWAGRVADGSDVEILPGGRRVRLRGIQVHGKAQSEALPGARTALNLAGVEIDDIGRGAWIVTPDRVPSPRVVDAHYRHLPDAPPYDGEAHLVVRWARARSTPAW